MKVLLNWPRKPQDPDTSVLIDELTLHGCEIVYWVGSPTSERIIPQGTLFHSYVDASDARGAPGLCFLRFPPPGRELIEQLYRVESVVLTMMDRFSAFAHASVNERRHSYYEMLRYWHAVLISYRPDAIVFPNMPHFVYDYILYELARLLKIKTIAFDETRVPGRLFLFTDMSELTRSIRKELKKQAGKRFSVDELAPDIRAYYIDTVSRKQHERPGYIKEQTKKWNMWSLSLPWKEIRIALADGSALRKAPRYLLWLLRTKGPQWRKALRTHVSYPFVSNLKKEYVSVSLEPDFSKKFVYFPLQKQPERTTSPQGEMFVDQILALEIASAALPPGWVVYVKEHPLQWAHFGVRFSCSRYRGYYAKIASLKNVIIVPLNTSSYRLIDESQAVTAVTGSAGWEAVLRGKTALIFGKVWYQDCPGIYTVGNSGDCASAFSTIRGLPVPKQAIVNFLKCFERITFRGFISPFAAKFTTVGKEECMRNIGQAIIEELRHSN